MFFVRFAVLALLWLFCLAVGQGNNGLAKVCAVLFVPLTVIIYLLPTYEAWKQENRNLMSVALLNVFLGWTVVAWVIALSWAFKKPETSAPAPVVAQAVQPLAAPAVEAPPTKTCPFCAETILSAAVKCKHCGSTLTSEPATT